MRATRPPRPSLLSRADEARLLAAMEADGSPLARRDHLLVRLLLATGIRVSSLVALDAEDVDIDHGRLHVPLKGEKRMEVALDPGLGAELLAGRQSGPLFASAQGRRLTTRAVQLRFAGWLRRAGIERAITVHSMRHTFGTRAYEATHDIRRVQRALGHGSVVTTERYVAACEGTTGDRTGSWGQVVLAKAKPDWDQILVLAQARSALTLMLPLPADT